MDDETGKIAGFLLEIEKLKAVKRVVYVSGGRRETTPEHVWHMCMYAILLGNGKADMLKTLKMILVHDLVEVYAGDASVWNEKAREGKMEREQEAAEKLFAMLPAPHNKEFMQLWEEFEEHKSGEAEMSKIFDGLQAVGQQVSSGGRAWKEQGVTLDMLVEKSRSYGYGKGDSTDAVWEEFFRLAKENNMFAEKP
ncbi:MAG: HD domain-containing protein [Candidatus Aenigmarchaeota archaeon]|nr:HD domain-containing protein [Candidatus Aenigmarchaeota archaeon]